MKITTGDKGPAKCEIECLYVKRPKADTVKKSEKGLIQVYLGPQSTLIVYAVPDGLGTTSNNNFPRTVSPYGIFCIEKALGTIYE